MKVDSLYRKLIREKARAKFKVSGQLPDTCQHGSHQAYVYYACRCAICITSHNKYQLDLAKSTPIRHGTLYGYKTQGCRCDECRLKIRDYFRAYRAKEVAA